MLTRRTVLTAAILLALPQAGRATERDPQDIIAAVDALRLPGEAEVGVKIALRMTDGTGSKRTVTNASVITRDKDALVNLLDGDQRGMKVLSTAQGYWIYAPNTRRAMRMTPQQMVRGQANAGDIARLRFSADYDVAFAADKTAIVAGRECWTLTLKAKSAAATYASILLHVAKTDGAPVDADLFVASGKRIKTAQFGPIASLNGHRLIAVITYIDGVDPAKRTTVELLSIQRADAPAGMFKPEALPAGL